MVLLLNCATEDELERIQEDPTHVSSGTVYDIVEGQCFSVRARICTCMPSYKRLVFVCNLKVLSDHITEPTTVLSMGIYTINAETCID